MTRTPRVVHATRDRAAALRERVSAKVAVRTLVYLGAGLALVGAGAAAVAGLVGGTATVADRSDVLDRKAESFAGAQPRSTTGHLVNHAATHENKPAEPASPAPAKPGAQAPSGQRVAAARRNAGHSDAKRLAKPDETWQAIERTVAAQTVPAPGRGPLPAQDRLTPTGTSGPQQWMPITAARYQNAATIVRQALDQKMGLRSAVIAVATAMQESTLLNINYGDRDSVGLFQQRPSAGWGTATQILRPVYAADAFLSALRTYEANNPAWARQPLWQPAQGVQASGFPYAYAKWEAQAAQLVGTVTRHLI